MAKRASKRPLKAASRTALKRQLPNLVILGFGVMGKTFASLLKSRFDITILNRSNKAPQARKLGVRFSQDFSCLKTADFVLVALPIDTLDNITKKISPLLKKDCLVIDVCSVKEYPKDVMKKNLLCPFLLTHPLFGKIDSLEGKKIVICNHLKNQKAVYFISTLKNQKAKLLDLTPKEHDKLLGLIQGITHFLGISLNMFTQKLNKDKLERFSTPTFDFLLGLMDKMDENSYETFFQIQKYNPYVSNNRKLLIESLNEFERRIAFISDQLDPASLVKSSYKIGILGPLGTFSEEAARAYSPSSQLIPYKNIDDVFKAVKEGEVKKGIVPLENLLNGHVIQTLDNLFKNKYVKISDRILLPVKHCLCTSPETKSIKRIMSHSQALAQCKIFLEKHYQKAEKQSVESTAYAMQLISGTELLGVAALGSKAGALRYGLKVVQDDIGDSTDNITVFAVLSRSTGKKTGNDRSSVAIYPQKKDRPGLLRDILDIIASHDINLEMIQSRPDGKGKYVFYIDFKGHELDKVVQDSLRDIKKKLGKDCGTVIHFLGSYPHFSF